MNLLILLIAIVVTLPEATARKRDTEYPWSVYSIRGGPEPEAVPNHYWVEWSSLDFEITGQGWPHIWRLYRFQGAPPHRQTEETFPSGTWVPKELDTLQRRARRARQGNSGLTNYEIYEEPTLAVK